MSELAPGKAIVIAPGVRRLVAPNPGMMTGPGTNTYLVGETDIAVIDPGPRIERHIDAIEAQSPGVIRWILCTHTHPDHSPGAALLAAATGAELHGLPAPEGKVQDKTFAPAVQPNDGDVLEGPDFALRSVYTPGHASNHLCFRHESHRMLFTGDHIMAGSTVVIDPPDGNMTHYLASLEILKELNLASLAPGHGPVIDNPLEVIDWLIKHRLKRESRVVGALQEHPGLTLWELTPHVYEDVDEKLHRLASRSLLAHLLKLEADGLASCAGEKWHLNQEVAES